MEGLDYSVLRFSLTEQLVVVFVTLLIFAFNALSFSIILKTKRTPRNTRFLTCGLIIFDLLGLSTVALRTFVPDVSIAFEMLAVGLLLNNTSYVTVVMMCIERTVLCVSPMRYMNYFRHAPLKKIAIVVWVTFPFTAVFSRYVVCGHLLTNILQLDQCQAYVASVVSGNIFIVIIISFCCYAKIFTILRNKRPRVQAPMNRRQSVSQYRPAATQDESLIHRLCCCCCRMTHAEPESRDRTGLSDKTTASVSGCKNVQVECKPNAESPKRVNIREEQTLVSLSAMKPTNDTLDNVCADIKQNANITCDDFVANVAGSGNVVDAAERTWDDSVTIIADSDHVVDAAELNIPTNNTKSSPKSVNKSNTMIVHKLCDGSLHKTPQENNDQELANTWNQTAFDGHVNECISNDSGIYSDELSGIIIERTERVCDGGPETIDVSIDNQNKPTVTVQLRGITPDIGGENTAGNETLQDRSPNIPVGKIGHRHAIVSVSKPDKSHLNQQTSQAVTMSVRNRNTYLVFVYLVTITFALASVMITAIIGLNMHVLNFFSIIISMFNSVSDPCLYVFWFEESKMEMLRILTLCRPSLVAKVHYMRIKIHGIVTVETPVLLRSKTGQRSQTGTDLASYGLTKPVKKY